MSAGELVVAAPAGRLRRVGAAMRRTTLIPALVRLLGAIAAAGTVVVAAPPALFQLPAALTAAAAVAGGLVGLVPRTRWVGLLLFGVVLEWLATTIGADGAIGPVRLALLAVGIYLTHATAGLAAVLPYDCLVAWRVLGSWATRVLTVLVVGVGVGLGGWALTGILPSARSVVGPIVGSVVAAGLTGLLAWHLRRK